MHLPPIFAAEVEALSMQYGAPRMVDVMLEDGDFLPLTKGDRVGEVCMVVQRPSGDLLVFRKTFYPKGVLRLLTGGIDHGEPIAAALLREVAEETSLEVTVSRFLAAIRYRSHDAPPNRAFYSFAFLLAEVGGELLVADPAERVDLFAERAPHELPALADVLDHLADRNDPEIGGNWRAWGRFRAVVHRVVAEALAA